MRSLFEPRLANPRARPTSERVLAGSALAACLGLLAYKLFLINRLNINWDEFYFLSHVHALERGDLTLLMQGAFTHLFLWLTLVPGDEIQQIIVARWVMLALLCVTCWLVWRLSRIWLSGFAALVPCIVYLSAVPVLLHGGSFRSDSMLAPLSLAALVLMMSPNRDAVREWAAGALIGLAFVITVKAVLFAPLFVVAAIARADSNASTGRRHLQEIAMAIGRIGAAAGIVAASLLTLHSLTISTDEANSVANFASSTARKTLLETQWFPRINFLQAYLRWQPLPWLLMALGTILALVRRRLRIAALALSLLPIAFYRNAFPYYYVVMLAPASVLAGFAVQEMTAVISLRLRPALAAVLTATILIGLLYQGMAFAGRLRIDGQASQRALLSAVHEIFPEPQNYADRCGMISSFRKVNFFMSTWGMEVYRNRNTPFMPSAIRDRRLAFVLVNSAALDAAGPSGTGLLPEDSELIEQFYPTYWGPIRVAGATTTLLGPDAKKVEVPYPADYRLFAPSPVLIDGMLRHPGDVFHVSDEGVLLQAPAVASGDVNLRLALFLAAAKPPPSAQLPDVPLFGGL